MRFLIVPQDTIPVHARILRERPLGGTETGIVRIAESLTTLGHEVRVITDYDNPPLSTPLYLPRRALASITDTDVLIAVRQWQAGLLSIAAKVRLFWTGDAYDQPQTIGLGDKRIIELYTAVLAVSEWQAETLSCASGFPRNRFWVIKNGVRHRKHDPAIKKDPNRLIYSSTPCRGLEHLVRLFPRIIAKAPATNLHVFSDYEVYRGADGRPPPGYEENTRRFEALKRDAAKIRNIYFRGNVRQDELDAEMQLASIFAYPNTFMETSCISVLEAMANGCAIVTSRRAALPETVGAAGILISGEPGTASYDDQFVAAIVNLLANRDQRETFGRHGRESAARQRWDDVANTLINHLHGAL